jgi:hypothetical protein
MANNAFGSIPAADGKKDVDAGHKAGHDGQERA